MRRRSRDSLLSRLGQLFQWAVFVLALSVVFHFLVVLAIPNVTVMSASRQISKAGGLNDAIHFDRRSGNRLIEGDIPNPDLLTSVCSFSLVLGPIKLSSDVPDGLWSVSIYSDNRELIHNLNEEAARGGRFEAILAGTGQQFANPGAVPEIRVSRFTGIAVFRTVIDPNEDLEAQKKRNNTARCDPVQWLK